MKNETIKAYWKSFLESLPSGSPYRKKKYSVISFGSDPSSADELGQLVVSGIKTGSASALWEWEAARKPITQPGSIAIVLDGKGQPLCIIEYVKVYACHFNAVDEEFARMEGEGDLSLKYWQETRMRQFTRTLPKIGKQFSEEMPLLCEEFQVIYK